VTSHDVVAVARRALGEKRIGHTGTLDPLATGVLPLALGRATRLVRFLSSADKDYEAVIRFGLTTDSYDITGAETSRSDTVPSREDVECGLVSLRGEYHQMPPAYSAKRVGRQRAYTLARRDQPVELKAVPVRVSRADLLELSGTRAVVVIRCSAGFYVRSFAQALGALTGAGACLEALRRTRSGDFTLAAAVSLDMLAADASSAAARVIPLDELLPGMPAARLTDEGRRRVIHGREIEAAHLAPGGRPATLDPHPPGDRDGAYGHWVRLLDASHRLVALATQDAPGSALHPAVVLI
jgi:tRNA pseudouridine55 synthase